MEVGPDMCACPADIFWSPDRRSFSKELSNADINTWMLKVSDHGANLNLGVGPAPLREGVTNIRVSLFGFVFAACVISSPHHAHDLA
jgi:hypothetical protein